MQAIICVRVVPAKPPKTHDVFVDWGQSLEYKQEIERYSRGRASFEEIAGAMGDLVDRGTS